LNGHGGARQTYFMFIKVGMKLPAIPQNRDVVAKGELELRKAPGTGC